MQRQTTSQTSTVTLTQTTTEEVPTYTPLLDRIVDPLTPLLEETLISHDHEEALAINERLEDYCCGCGHKWDRCLRSGQLSKDIGR